MKLWILSARLRRAFATLSAISSNLFRRPGRAPITLTLTAIPLSSRIHVGVVLVVCVPVWAFLFQHVESWQGASTQRVLLRRSW